MFAGYKQKRITGHCTYLLYSIEWVGSRLLVWTTKEKVQIHIYLCLRKIVAFPGAKLGFTNRSLPDLPGNSGFSDLNAFSHVCSLTYQLSLECSHLKCSLLPCRVGSACCGHQHWSFSTCAPRGVGPRQECQSKARTPRWTFKSSPIADGQGIAGWWSFNHC